MTSLVVGDGSRVRVRNRWSFVDTGDLRAQWTLSDDGGVIAEGPLEAQVAHDRADDGVMGEDPDTGLPVERKSGRFGPYVERDRVFASVHPERVPHGTPLHEVERDYLVAGRALVELIAERESVEPGDTLYVALKMDLDEGWHVYWRNAGDAGLPPLVDVLDTELSALFRRAAGLLAQNTRGGPRVTRRSTDEAGILWVYGRTGQPCLQCGHPVEGMLLGAFALHAREGYLYVRAEVLLRAGLGLAVLPVAVWLLVTALGRGFLADLLALVSSRGGPGRDAKRARRSVAGERLRQSSPAR